MKIDSSFQLRESTEMRWKAIVAHYETTKIVRRKEVIASTVKGYVNNVMAYKANIGSWFTIFINKFG